METFEIVAKKNKRQLTKKIITVSFMVIIFCIIVGLSSYMTLRHFTKENFLKIENYYRVKNFINQPNLIVGETKVTKTSQLQGLYTVTEQKDLDGVKIPYQNLESTYWYRDISLRNHIEQENWPLSDGSMGLYHVSSGYKVAQFENVHISEKMRNGEPIHQELPLIHHMENQLVEVAITFDKSYSYDDISAMIPDNLKINWYWFGTHTEYDVNEYDANRLFGLTLNSETKGTEYNSIISELKTMNLSDYFKYSSSGDSAKNDLEQYLKEMPTLKEAKFSGLILTGKAENFAQLDGKSWIYASSIGASIPNQPYYKLDKE
ncbi:MAG: anti sigma factor C-terminal domain-containing protein [Streptococcus sp.]|nr:anti sigma factor C-terminal domain-containing protein [Streptococcus sp.]